MPLELGERLPLFIELSRILCRRVEKLDAGLIFSLKLGGLILANTLGESLNGLFIAPASSFEAQGFVRRAKVAGRNYH
jgi:hypothetical protein